MEKLKLHTADMAERNVELLGQMFPNCLTEVINADGKLVRAIDFDKLRQELACEVVEGAEERYQFTWPDKRAAIRLANAPTNKTLRPCREESVDFDNTENLYIEGDNLEVLKLLRENYLGKVKMIYIDPPYNTGNDFVYNDDFAQGMAEFEAQSGLFDEEGRRMADPMVQNTESNGRFHTDWLNMIYPRLKVAKDLLADDGVIFISIDDNEQVNLTKVCDEIFGADNKIGPIIQNKQNAKNDTLNIQKNHEFILVYRKRCCVDNGTVLPTILNTSVKYRDVYEEDGKYYFINDSITTRGAGGTLNARPNLGYTVYYNPITKDKIGVFDYDVEKARFSNIEDEIYTDDKQLLLDGYIAIRPPKVRGMLGCWTWSLDKFNSQKESIIITGNNGNNSVKKRTFVDSCHIECVNGKFVYGDITAANSRSILDFSTNDGTTVMNEIMSVSGVFSNPKNIAMLQYFTGLVPSKDFIILDFFSGSATTAHAVMQLNAEDGGNRKFIMVQLPEKTDERSEAYKLGYKNICEIGKERIRRAGKKVKEEAGLQGQNLDTGFRVLKLDESNMADVYYTPADTPIQQTLDFDKLVDNIREGRTAEDLLFQVLPECNLPLSSKIEIREIHGKKVFVVEDGYLMACFDSDINDAVITAIAKEKPYNFVMCDRSIATDNVADNFDQIFNAYSKETVRRVL